MVLVMKVQEARLQGTRLQVQVIQQCLLTQDKRLIYNNNTYNTQNVEEEKTNTTL